MGVFGKIWRFYADGFRSMTIGRSLWAIIIIKMVVLFLVLKLFFFPNILKRDYSTDAERAEAVRSALSAPADTAGNSNQTINQIRHE